MDKDNKEDNNEDNKEDKRKTKNFTWKIYVAHKKEKPMLVASGCFKDQKEAEETLQYYSTIYAQLGLTTIKKSWKEE